MGLVRTIGDFPRMIQEEQDGLVSELLDYECYAQATRLLEWRVNSPDQSSNQRLVDFCTMMEIQFHGLEAFDVFLQTAKRCVAELALPFSSIRLLIADGILGPSQFLMHAQLYRMVADVLSDRSQHVLLLSRLALITEKKLFQEYEVEPIYKQIITLDPLNIRALRFYRMWNIQAGDWIAAAGHLHVLLKAYRNPNEQQRAAHELAQIYLYSLNQPGRARQILLAHCSDSHLDTRQTLVEALERIGSYDELLECLDEMHEKATSRHEIAAILLKKGQTLIKRDRFSEAEQCLSECLTFDPANLLIHEALISAQVAGNRPGAVVETLMVMSRQAVADDNGKRLHSLAKSIADLWPQGVPVHFELETKFSN
jgi:tetratricopeptide (TPR) repeat protein